MLGSLVAENKENYVNFIVNWIMWHRVKASLTWCFLCFGLWISRCNLCFFCWGEEGRLTEMFQHIYRWVFYIFVCCKHPEIQFHLNHVISPVSQNLIQLWNNNENSAFAVTFAYVFCQSLQKISLKPTLTQTTNRARSGWTVMSALLMRHSILSICWLWNGGIIHGQWKPYTYVLACSGFSEDSDCT